MSNDEVAAVLQEIRARVRSEPRASASTPLAIEDYDATADGEASMLARLETNLVVTARAWDKLPPLISYRHGLLRRFELWLKQQIKRATRWYTWEQVNFNAATNSALREALTCLRAQGMQLAAIKEEHEEQLLEMRQEYETQLTRLREQIATLASSSFVEQEIARLQFQMRELNEHALDEQRVCFKQFNLEASELLSMSDRAHRHTRMRLDELARQVEEFRRNLNEQQERVDHTSLTST